MFTTLHRLIPCMVAASLTTSAAWPAPAEPAVTIVALEGTVPAGNALIQSHGPETDALAIDLGDPLGLKITLANNTDRETSAIPVSLNPRWNFAHVVIVHPDGRETMSPLEDRRARSGGRPRAMKPDESIEAKLYAYVDAAARRDGKAQYLFPSPGEYRVYVAYFTSMGVPAENDDEAKQDNPALTAGERYISNRLEQIARRDRVVVSNSIDVHVGPAVPGWEELKREGIVEALGDTGAWVNPASDQQWRAKLQKVDALVAHANRPWLTAWYARARQDTLDRGEELENKSAEVGSAALAGPGVA